jgi:hypothetical protein
MVLLLFMRENEATRFNDAARFSCERTRPTSLDDDSKILYSALVFIVSTEADRFKVKREVHSDIVTDKPFKCVCQMKQSKMAGNQDYIRPPSNQEGLSLSWM